MAAQNDLRSPIRSRLNVVVAGVVREDRRAKIDHFHTSEIVLPKENVFWFDVAVDDSDIFQKFETDEQISKDFLEVANVDSLVRFDELLVE